MKLIIRGLCFS